MRAGRIPVSALQRLVPTVKRLIVAAGFMRAFLQADTCFEQLTCRLPIIFYLTWCSRSYAARIYPVQCNIVDQSSYIDFLPTTTLTSIPGTLGSLFVLETILRLMGRYIILSHRILGDITNTEAVFEEILLMEQPLLKRCSNIAQTLIRRLI